MVDKIKGSDIEGETQILELNRSVAIMNVLEVICKVSLEKRKTKLLCKFPPQEVCMLQSIAALN